MIRMQAQGRFPFEKLMKIYPFESIEHNDLSEEITWYFISEFSSGINKPDSPIDSQWKKLKGGAT